jgi:hypothetical protein
MTHMTKDFETNHMLLRMEELERSLLHCRKRFGSVIRHARCYICNDKIGDARWFLGGMGDLQEIYHADCFDQTSKKDPEEIIQHFVAPNPILEELPFEEVSTGEWPTESGDRTDFGFLLILPKNSGGEANRLPENVRPVSAAPNRQGDIDYQHFAPREWTGEAEP